MEKLTWRGLALAALLTVTPVLAAPPKAVDVTSDSTPGWIPSVAQREDAQKTARAFLAAEDSGNAEAAYGFFAALNKAQVPLDAFKTEVARLQTQLGAVIERRILKITWTKDSPKAPAPGVYAAFDLASRFAKAERHCGFLILYQPESGGDFQVMREEATILDNAQAADTARKQSAAAVDAAWAELSANCPNYPQHRAAP